MTLKVYSAQELKEILQNHKDWLNNNCNNKKASRADLSSADLCGANLYSADLRGADLCGANLYSANLHSANLCCANLCGANLHSADLRGADLCCANLCGANLRSADLYGANLSSAKNYNLIIAQQSILPETGSFIGYKKCLDNIIVQLQILPTAKRLNAFGSRKCRASKVKVLKFFNNPKRLKQAVSQHDPKFIYKIGKTLTVKDFDESFTECSRGIHFFLTKIEAENYWG